jgi:spore maturation protein CgeB
LKNKKINILVYGESIGWAMGPNLVDAFTETGCTATLFDFTQEYYTSNEVTIKNKILNRLFVKNITNNINKKLVAHVDENNYDFFLVLKGAGIYPDTLKHIKKKIKTIANWDPDDYFNNINNSKYLLNSLSLYDIVFSARDHLFDEYKKKGIKKTVLLDWYCMPKLQKKIEVTQNELNSFGSDIVFIANWSPRREEHMYALRAMDIKIYGQGWGKAKAKFKKAIKCHSPVYFPEMNKIVNASKINLNILTLENRDTSNFRNYEVPACGAFQLTERSSKITQIFKEDVEISCFSSVQEMKDKCEYYLSHEQEMNTIKKNAYQMINNGGSSINDRVKVIIDAITPN